MSDPEPTHLQQANDTQAPDNATASPEEAADVALTTDDDAQRDESVVRNRNTSG